MMMVCYYLGRIGIPKVHLAYNRSSSWIQVFLYVQSIHPGSQKPVRYFYPDCSASFDLFYFQFQFIVFACNPAQMRKYSDELNIYLNGDWIIKYTG